MDYRLYHGINVFVWTHAWLGLAMGHIEDWSIPVVAAATVGLWLLAPPRGDQKWRRTSVTALAAATVALLANQVIAHVWDRARPYVAHPDAHLWVAKTADASFPSDHASAAFAIAVAVLWFDRLVGSLFLAGAVLIATGRVLVGAHYPGDVFAGLLIGTAAGLIAVHLGRPILDRLVALISPTTDIILAPVWELGRRQQRP